MSESLAVGFEKGATQPPVEHQAREEKDMRQVDELRGGGNSYGKPFACVCRQPESRCVWWRNAVKQPAEKESLQLIRQFNSYPPQ